MKNRWKTMKGGKIPKHNGDFFVFNGNYSVIHKNNFIYRSPEPDVPVIQLTDKFEYEEVIEVPYTAADVAAGLDPFFQARNSVRDGKYDYYQWTPGLERMFAPTYPIKEWY